MTATNSYDAQLEKFSRASRRGAVVSLVGFLIVLGAMSYASLNLIHLEREQLQLRETNRQLSASNQQLSESVQLLRSRTEELVRTQEGVLDFLGGVTSGEPLRLLDTAVDWRRTRKYLLDMPAGPRKNAILAAILLAWKNIPFSMDNRGLGAGLDSPHFINLALQSAGVHVTRGRDERLSDAMMRQFKRVDSPLPGDLMFYRGTTGSFVVMYMAPGLSAASRVAVGTLQSGWEVQVLDTSNINTTEFPFIGFFRVPYPESQAQQ